MTNRIRNILRQLDQTREDLLALSDDIWLSIEHNDTKAMREGAEFKAGYNEKMAAFDKLAGELSALVQQFTRVKVEAETKSVAETSSSATDRIIRDLDKRTPHSLEEDFTYKRPYGFRLGNEAHSEVLTWRQLYALVCDHLSRLNPQVFKKLPENPDFISKHGNPSFSRDEKQLRYGIEVSGGLYAEANLSANGIRDEVKALLSTFGIDQKTMRIYLRQDRDAEE